MCVGYLEVGTVVHKIGTKAIRNLFFDSIVSIWYKVCTSWQRVFYCGGSAVEVLKYWNIARVPFICKVELNE